MPTVGEMVEKISELKSESAILKQLIMYLESYYKSSDSGEADMKITRDDHAYVPELHIDKVIDTLAERIEETTTTQEQLEKFLVTDPEEAVRKQVRTKKGKKNADQ